MLKDMEFDDLLTPGVSQLTNSFDFFDTSLVNRDMSCQTDVKISSAAAAAVTSPTSEWDITRTVANMKVERSLSLTSSTSPIPSPTSASGFSSLIGGVYSMVNQSGYDAAATAACDVKMEETSTASSLDSIEKQQVHIKAGHIGLASFPSQDGAAGSDASAALIAETEHRINKASKEHSIPKGEPA